MVCIQSTLIVAMLASLIQLSLPDKHQDKIPIGGIFPKSSEIYTAFHYAVNMANRHNILQYDLEPRVDFTDVSNSYNMAEKMCSQLSHGVFALFGVSNTSSSHIQQSLSQTLHVPFITPYMNSPRVALRSFTVSMSPEYISAMIDIIRFYRWSDIYFVYDTDDGLYHIQRIYEEFMYSRVRLRIYVWRITNIYACHSTLRHLDRSSDGDKYILVDLSSTSAFRAFLHQIIEVGMNRDQYHYVLGTLALTEIDLSPFSYGGVNITGFRLPVLEGNKKKRFFRKWNILTGDWPGWKTDYISTDSLLLIDGVMTFAHALSRLESSVFKTVFSRGQLTNHGTLGVPCNTTPLKPWKLGERILDIMLKTEYEGFTGDVTFDAFGNRNRIVLDVMEKSYLKPLSKIGTWDRRNGLRTSRKIVALEKSDKKLDNLNKTLIITTIQVDGISIFDVYIAKLFYTHKYKTLLT